MDLSLHIPLWGVWCIGLTVAAASIAGAVWWLVDQIAKAS